MKTTLLQTSLGSRWRFVISMLLAIFLGAASLIGSGLIPSPHFFRLYFPFESCILLLLSTWLMYRLDGESLRTIGLNITFRHMVFLAGGLLCGVLAWYTFRGLIGLLQSGQWAHFSTDAFSKGSLKNLYFILPTVVVQELMFRGYLFTRTIKQTNVVAANIIFAILFMLVHVLDRDVLKNPGQMIFLIAAIPVGHLLFATALLKSRTLYLSIGLHWGNNWATQYVSFTDSGKADADPHWGGFVIYLSLFCLFYLLLTWLMYRIKWWGPVFKY
ncbi:lysostaphin resistance A-like protein [Flavitalea flava]